MTFDLRVERRQRSARKFVMAATVYDWRFLQSNLFNLRLCSHYVGWLLRRHEKHTGSGFCSHIKDVRYSVNTYPIFDSPL